MSWSHCATNVLLSMRYGLALSLLSSALVPLRVPAAEPTPSALASLRPGHPRLLLLDERIAWLRQRSGEDELLAQLMERLRREAEVIAAAPMLVRKIDDGRLLSVSRECLRRSLVLGLAWRLDHDPRLLAALRGNLLTVAGFADWHPEHFLDVAEMCAGMAIGYDWAYHGLAPDDRETIRSALMRLGIAPGIAAEQEAAAGVAKKTNWWCGNAYNWNLVCHGGLTLAALALGETDPVPAEQLIACARREVPLALASYEPDGMWPEGLNYWRYATKYAAFLSAALDSSLGDAALPHGRPGFAQTGEMYVDQRSATGLLPGFSDVRSPFEFTGDPVLSWLGATFARPRLIALQHAMLRKQAAAAASAIDPLDIVWYQPDPRAVDAPAALDRHWRGQVEVASFRSGWDPTALSVYIKAGDNASGHAHLDIGSFEFDLLGEHWGTDLGSDRYDLPNYFGADRWSYFRLNSHSHNVPLINRHDQGLAGKGAMVLFVPGEDPRAIVDLSAAYATDALAVRRGVALEHGRSVLLIQDEISLAEPAEVRWGMTVESEIVAAGDHAILTKHGVSITARIIAPAGAEFTVESAEQEPPQARNSGVRRLVGVCPAQRGPLTIAVRFGAGDGDALGIKPLSAW